MGKSLVKPEKHMMKQKAASVAHHKAVAEIMDDMLEGRWWVGKSHRDYSERYGVVHNTVVHWASEASLFIRMCSGNTDAIRERIIANLITAQRLAIDGTKTFVTKDGEHVEVPHRDLKAFIAATELLARMHGVDKPKDTPTEQVSEEELAELLRARGYRVEAPEPEAGGESPEVEVLPDGA